MTHRNHFTLLFLFMVLSGTLLGNPKNHSKLWRTPAVDPRLTTLNISTDQTYFHTEVDFSTAIVDGSLAHLTLETLTPQIILTPGQYEIKLSAGGYREHQFLLNAFLGQDQHLYFELNRFHPFTAFSQSVIFPGGGQFYLDQKAKALVLSVMYLNATLGMIASHRTLQDYIEEYHFAELAYTSNRDAHLMNYYYSARVKSFNRMKDMELTRNILAGIAIATYTYNIFDILYSTSRLPDPENATLHIQISPYELKLKFRL